jgi:glycosyltransferase involved in cell wall biosynthesis
VLAQTSPVDEIVVVDDGSKDDTKNAIGEFGGAVHYVYQENAGSSAARNTGIVEAAGDWIAFLDADDTWRPSKMSLQLQILERHRDLAWIAGAYDNVQEGQFLTACKPPTPEAFASKGVVGDALQLFAEGGSIWTGTVMIRRDVFDEIGDFDVGQRTSHDLDLWLRIAVAHPNLGWVDETIANYEINNPSGLTSTSVQRGDETLIDFYRRAHQLNELLPPDRKRHLQDYMQCHAWALTRDFLGRGSREKAQWLLGHLKRIGIRVPLWLDVATRIPPTLVRPIHAGFSYTRGVFCGR